jgi:superfamily II DNA or RNA helicase
MTLLLEGTLKQIKEAAAKGALTWKGQKVIFDPFLPLDLIVEAEGVSEFTLTPYIVIGSRVEKPEVIFPLGALQGGVFRLWKEPYLFSLLQTLPSKVSPQTLTALLDKELPIRWKGKKPRLKPAPLPILKLTDRTGGFANLELDYGVWGIEEFQGSTEEEVYWERDLLETPFKKKIVDTSHYFCPLDQVGKALSFLLDMGWKVVDYRGKQVVRQQSIDCKTEETPDAFMLRGTVSFGEKTASIQDVVGTFQRRERWIDLSPHEVGLIELPSTWESVLDEERTLEGIRIRKAHMGVLEGVAPLPPTYLPTQWQETLPTEAFRGTLFPYQQKGLSWLSFLYRAGFSGLLADEMGLGKTVQVLAFLTQQSGSVLIVMPVSLLSVWKHQIKQFLPTSSVYLHQGPHRVTTAEELEAHPLILTSYSTVRQDAALFSQISFETVILDEAQVIKNSKAQISQTLYRLKSRFKLALTGTPIENRPEEIFSIFRFLMPTLFDDETFNETARRKMKPFILRRTKEEVGLDLPEKMIQTIGVTPSEEEFALYENLLRTKKAQLSENRMEVLELILRLRQHCSHPRLLDPSYTGDCSKFAQVLIDLDEVIASNRKVLVYSQFTSTLKVFEEEFQRRGWTYAYLDGSTRDRETPVYLFQNDPSVQIFLISLKAGGIGLNLQAADYVFLYDPWWNSAAENQAIDRAHRIGRKERVIARKYFTTESIEAKILELQSKKQAVAETLWDDREVMESLSFEEIKALLF